MTSHTKQRLITVLTKLVENQDWDIEDIDEIGIYADNLKDELSEKTFRLIDKLSGLDIEDSPHKWATAHRLASRCLRALEVEDSIWIQPEPGSTSALIPSFIIDEDDKEKISKLCSDMRKIVFASNVFDEPHRLRLLNRIAAIEAETQKPKGMFDVVRGGIDDLGETLGKFGTDIKPLTDRMKEVVSIARRGTKEYDQLPEPEEVKSLPAPTDDEQ
ncbi:MAG: hypothetical protein AAGF94_15795 [Pseudomonadota bacterium]